MNRYDALVKICRDGKSDGVPVYPDQPDGPRLAVTPQKAAVMLAVREMLEGKDAAEWETLPLSVVYTSCKAYHDGMMSQLASAAAENSLAVLVSGDGMPGVPVGSIAAVLPGHGLNLFLN